MIVVWLFSCLVESNNLTTKQPDNIEINPCSKKNSVVKRTRIERIERISFNLVVPLEIGFNSLSLRLYDAG